MKLGIRSSDSKKRRITGADYYVFDTDTGIFVRGGGIYLPKFQFEEWVCKPLGLAHIGGYFWFSGKAYHVNRCTCFYDQDCLELDTSFGSSARLTVLRLYLKNGLYEYNLSYVEMHDCTLEGLVRMHM